MYTNKNKEELYNLIDLYWNDYTQKKEWEFIVKPSIPIVWFGNLYAYLNSKVKILTVSLNPSKIEFYDSRTCRNSFVRFREAEKIYNENKLNLEGKDILINSLNKYFDAEPYWQWFNNYEKLLNTFDSTYYIKTKYANRSIHIDIYSALATDPTWSGLDNYTKNKIQQLELYKNLFSYLNPDIVFVSINKEAFNEVFSNIDLIESYKFENDDKRTAIELYLDKRRIIIKGHNAKGTPFGMMGDNWKANKMEEIKQVIFEINNF